MSDFRTLATKAELRRQLLVLLQTKSLGEIATMVGQTINQLVELLNTHTQNLEQLIQLHENVRIYSCVDGYIAVLECDDGNTEVHEEKADTIDQAISKLDNWCKGKNLKNLRAGKYN